MREDLIDEDPGLTCHQVKLRLILAGVVHQTIQRIIHVKFDIPSMVHPKVPFLTEVGRQKRLSGARTKNDVDDDD